MTDERLSSQIAPAAPLFLSNLATALPTRSIRQTDAVERMAIIYPEERTQRLLRRLARNTGIETRHMVALDWQAGDAELPPLYLSAAEQPHGPGMGVRNRRFAAASRALLTRAAASLPATGPAAESLSRVKTLVTASCTHASSPGLEAPLLEMLENGSQLQRWNLGFMGCSAGLAALRLARSLEGAAHPTLIAACELSSLHFQYSDALDQLTANLLFADGAAIALLDGNSGPLRVDACACAHLPAAAEQMVWFADDHGLRLHLAAELPETLEAHVAGAVTDFLAARGLEHEDIAHWIVHPGGPQILDGVARALQLAPHALDDSRAVLRAFGNMSSVTVFFILKRLIERRAEGRCVAIAFGPGLTIELALLHFVEDA